MSFSVHILGSGAALPTGRRQPTSQYINCNERHILIDCGEGTQQQLRNYGIKLQRIAHICISHLHGDHFFGLPGLLSTMHLLGRDKKLSIYGPAGLENLIRAFLEAGGHPLTFDIQFQVVDPSVQTCVFEDNLIRIEAFALKHRIPTFGYRILEKEKPRHLIQEAIQEAGLLIEDYHKLKAGLDIERDGRIYKNADFTLAAKKPLSYAFCSDTKAVESYLPAISGTTLLYHEATFTEQHKERAKVTFHSTAAQAAQQAQNANCTYLLLGHFSSRYADETQHVIEAKAIHNKVLAATDGLLIDLEKIARYF
ncbi:MAG: hypothetical protein RLZZ301_565 [Bacteroidota bacterium]|jgi:ribonuclease Z